MPSEHWRSWRGLNVGGENLKQAAVKREAHRQQARLTSQGVAAAARPDP